MKSKPSIGIPSEGPVIVNPDLTVTELRELVRTLAEKWRPRVPTSIVNSVRARA